MAGISPEQRVSSSTILAPGQIVTGVRGFSEREVVLTGASAADDSQTAFIYVGPLPPANDAHPTMLPPVFAGQTVTGSTYYGPDTFKFNPTLGAGNVRLVGSYQYAGSGARNHGMIYQGSPSGDGAWTQIDVPSSAVGGKAVENTIAHSTMGDLVVGNYDLQGSPLSANAFVYNIANDSWTIFDLGDTVSLVTAYGIWQAEIGSSVYTIVGGAKDRAGINKGLVVTYDSQTGKFSNLKFYTYDDDPALLTHFEGITMTAAGFNLAGGSSKSSALLAAITVAADGSFSEASWSPFAYPGAELTTGNSIYQNVLMGLYVMPDHGGTGTYVATFG